MLIAVEQGKSLPPRRTEACWGHSVAETEGPARVIASRRIAAGDAAKTIGLTGTDAEQYHARGCDENAQIKQQATLGDIVQVVVQLRPGVLD